MNRIMMGIALAVHSACGSDDSDMSLDGQGPQLTLNERKYAEEGGAWVFQGGGCMSAQGGPVRTFSRTEAQVGWGIELTTALAHTGGYEIRMWASSQGKVLISRTFDRAFLSAGREELQLTAGQRNYRLFYWGGPCSRDLSVPDPFN